MDQERIADKLASYIEGETSLDGLSKATAVRRVNSLLSKYSKGLFKDVGWGGVDRIWKAMDSAVINWELKSNRYIEDRDTGESNTKEWKFEVYFDDKNGRFKKLHGVVIAMAAGSVKEPWDRYDLAAYVS